MDTWLAVAAMKVLELILTLVVIVGSIAAIAIVIAVDGWHSDLGTRFEAVATIVSGAAFILFVFSLRLQRHDLELQRQELSRSVKALEDSAQSQRQLTALSESQRDAQLFELNRMFLSEPMRSTRKTVWQMSFNWQDEAYRSYLREVIKVELTKGYRTLPRWRQLRQDPRYADYSALHDLVQFFSMVHDFPASDDVKRACGFYYHWWNEFINEMADEFDSAYASVKCAERGINVKPPWIEKVRSLRTVLLNGR